ncbi:MAG TPA: hypothetical protein VGK59_13835 [Ohtaekwangia sp.]
MKTKVLLLIAAAAVVTLSFASVNRTETKGVNATEVKQSAVEPAGGFIIEDKL